MELAAEQKLLARVYTDSTLRNRFFADPVGIGAAFGLSPDTARQLAALPKDQVHQFTKALRRHRLESVFEELPLSRKLFGRRFAELFKDYVVKHQLPENGFPWKDAVQFVRHAIQNAKPSVEVARWELEFMRYEATRLEFNHSPDRARTFFSLYRVNSLDPPLKAGDIPESCPALPCFTLFWRWTVNHPIATLSL